MQDNESVVYPPSKWHIKDEGRLIFLAGSNGLDNWQDRAIDILYAADQSLHIACPRNDNWPTEEELIASYGVADRNFLQKSWELAHIRTASATGGIMFWLDKDFAVDDRSEMFVLAEWITNYKWKRRQNPPTTIKLVIGISDDCSDRNYILTRLFDDCPEFMIATNLEETCKMMIEGLQ